MLYKHKIDRNALKSNLFSKALNSEFKSFNSSYVPLRFFVIIKNLNPRCTYLFRSLVPLCPLTPFIVGVLGAEIPFSLQYFACRSWHSFTDASNSFSLVRSHSTVKLSTVNVFACNFPNLSSIRPSSNWNKVGVGGQVLKGWMF